MCRHNAGYWQRLEYLGFGLGASSLYGGMRFSNTHQMQEYLKESRNPDQIRKDVTVLSRNEQIEEFMVLGLRMTEGKKNLKKILMSGLWIFTEISCKNMKKQDLWNI